METRSIKKKLQDIIDGKQSSSILGRTHILNSPPGATPVRCPGYTDRGGKHAAQLTLSFIRYFERKSPGNTTTTHVGDNFGMKRKRNKKYVNQASSEATNTTEIFKTPPSRKKMKTVKWF
jgi:hypothetical protein